MTNYYDELGVPQGATDLQVREAYLKIAKSADPDSSKWSDEFKERSKRVLEAYNTLNDREKRRAYDQFIGVEPTSLPPTPAPLASWPPTPQSGAAGFACVECKRDDIVLKIYRYAWVTSFLVLTRYGQNTYYLCKVCHPKKTSAALVKVLLTGWWGFPWGIIRTIMAIVQNARGGAYPKDLNAQFLAAQGQQFHNRKQYSEALECLTESNTLAPHADKQALIAQARAAAAGAQ